MYVDRLSTSLVNLAQPLPPLQPIDLSVILCIFPRIMLLVGCRRIAIKTAIGNTHGTPLY